VITKTLKIAEPTIVPAPRFWCQPPLSTRNNAKILVNNSGALLPIAIKVAHVISEDILSLLVIFSNAAVKYSSHTIARRYEVMRIIIIYKKASIFS